MTSTVPPLAGPGPGAVGSSSVAASRSSSSISSSKRREDRISISRTSSPTFSSRNDSKQESSSSSAVLRSTAEAQEQQQPSLQSLGSEAAPAPPSPLLPSPQQQQQQQRRREDGRGGDEMAFNGSSPTIVATRTKAATKTSSPRNHRATSTTSSRGISESLADGAPKMDSDPLLPVGVVLRHSKRSKLRLPLSPPTTTTRTAADPAVDTGSKDRIEGERERGECRSLPDNNGGRPLLEKKKYSSAANSSSSSNQGAARPQSSARDNISDPPDKSATTTTVEATTVEAPSSTQSESGARRPSPRLSMSSKASLSLRSRRRKNTVRSPSGGGGGSAASTSVVSARYASHNRPAVATATSSSSSSTRPLLPAIIVTCMDNAATVAASSSAALLDTPCMADDDATTNSNLVLSAATHDDDGDCHQPANKAPMSPNKTMSTVGRFIDILNEKQELLSILKEQQQNNINNNNYNNHDSLHHVESRSTMSPILHSTALQRQRHHYQHAEAADARATIDNTASSENDMEGIVSLLDDVTLADLSRYIDAIQTKEDGSSLALEGDDEDDMEHSNSDGPGMALTASENLGKLSSPRPSATSSKNHDPGSAPGVSSQNHKKSRNNSASSSSSHRLEDTLAVVQDFIDSKKQTQQQEQEQRRPAVDIGIVKSTSFNEGDDVDTVEPAALTAVSSFLDALANVREARRSTATTSSGNDDHRTCRNDNSRSEVDACDNQKHDSFGSRKLILVNTGPATGGAAAVGHKFVLVNTGPSHLRDGGDEKTVATEEFSETDYDNSTAAGAEGVVVDPNSNKGTTASRSGESGSRDHSKNNRASGSTASSSRQGGSGQQQHRSRKPGESTATTASHPISNQEPTSAKPQTPIASANDTKPVGASDGSHQGGTTSSRISASSRPSSRAQGTTSSQPTKPPSSPKTTAASRQSNTSKHASKPPAILDLIEDTTAAVIPSVNMVGPSDVVSLLGSLASTPRRSKEEERLYKQLLKLRDKAGRTRRDDGHSFATEDLLPETLAMIEAYIAHIQVAGSASQDAEEDINVPVETSNEIADFIDLLTAKNEGKQQQLQHVKAPVSIRVKKDPPSAFDLKVEKEKEVVKVAKDPPIKDTLSAEFDRYVSGNREPEINPAKREQPTGIRDIKGKYDTHSGQLVEPELVAVSGDRLRPSETIYSTQNSRRETPIEPEIVELLSDDDFLTSSTDANSGFREDDNQLITDMLELSTCASSSNNASEGHSAQTLKRFGKERETGTGSAIVNRHVQSKPPRGKGFDPPPLEAKSSSQPPSPEAKRFDPPLKATNRAQPPSPEAKHRIRSPPVSPVLLSQAEEKKMEDQPFGEDPLLENEVFLRLSEAVQIPINDIDQQRALAAVVRNAFPHFKAFPPTSAKLYEILVEAAEVGLSSQVARRFIRLAQAQLKNRLDDASPDDHLEAKARNHANHASEAHDTDIIAFLCRLLNVAPVVFKSTQEETSSTSGPSRSPSPSQQSESGQEAIEVDLERGLIEKRNSGDSEDEGPWWETVAKSTSKSWKYYKNAYEDESDQDPVSDSERSSSIDQKRSRRRVRQGKRTPQQTIALADLSESRSDYTSAGENMINRPMSNRSDADQDMNYFWHSREETRKRRLQFRNRNGKSYVQVPTLNTASFSHTTIEESSLPSKNRRLRAGTSYESEEEAWLAKRSMAKWGLSTPWSDPIVLFARHKETVYPVRDPKPINGVDSAKSLYAASAIWKSRRESGLGSQWYQSYGIRTQGHPGFFDIDVFSLYEVSVAGARHHPQDKVAWEYRHVKQRFLYEQSLFSRNWFGDLDEKLVGPIIRFPICQPKSMEMPMRAPEWSPEWYRGPYLAPLGSNLSGASFQAAIPGCLRDEIEEYDQDAWEETPECGTFKNTKPQLKCGERITLVTPDLVSSLRRSRWRRKYFPKGTFPY
jgi:hypothetical protein